MELHEILKHYSGLTKRERDEIELEKARVTNNSYSMKERANKLNITVGQATDILFSHNEIIALWYIPEKDPHMKHELYHGEAWATPKEYQDLKLIRFFGAIPEKISEGDRINILVKVDESNITLGLRPVYPDRSNESEEVL